jgi:hypothetical protein
LRIGGVVGRIVVVVVVLEVRVIAERVTLVVPLARQLSTVMDEVIEQGAVRGTEATLESSSCGRASQLFRLPPLYMFGRQGPCLRQVAPASRAIV